MSEFSLEALERLQVRRDWHKVLSPSISQGVIGPRGDPGPAGPPGPPVSTCNNPLCDLSSGFILFLFIWPLFDSASLRDCLQQSLSPFLSWKAGGREEGTRNGQEEQPQLGMTI